MFGVTHSPPSSQDLRLPRGECRFILLHPEINGQRCSCQGFWLNKSGLGSSCECGHQACYHEQNVPDDSVGREEHRALLARVAQLEDELGKERATGKGVQRDDVRLMGEILEKERTAREEDIRGVYRAIQGVYHNMDLSQNMTSNRLIDQDDKIEGAIDKAAECAADLKATGQRLAHVEDMSMALEDKLDELGRRLGRSLPSTSRPDELSNKINQTDRPSQTVPVEQHTWIVNARLLPNCLRSAPFPVDTNAYYRSLSRGLYRPMKINGTDYHSVQAAVETCFGELLDGRPWMPLKARVAKAQGSSSHTSLENLSEQERRCELWDEAFLEQTCTITPSRGRPSELFIAPRDDNISWAEIRQRTVSVHGMEQFWEHDEVLDGPRSTDNASSSQMSILPLVSIGPPEPPPLSLSQPELSSLPPLDTGILSPRRRSTSLSPSKTALLKRTLSSATSTSETSGTTPTSARASNDTSPPKRFKLCGSLPAAEKDGLMLDTSSLPREVV